MSEAKYWVSKNGAEAEGPYWRGKLVQLYDMGSLAPDDQICMEGTVDWLPAKETVDLIKQEQALPVNQVYSAPLRPPAKKRGVNSLSLFALTLLFMGFGAWLVNHDSSTVGLSSVALGGLIFLYALCVNHLEHTSKR